MSKFHFQAWIKDGRVCTVQTCDLPITHDPVSGAGCHCKVCGEIEGDLVLAGELFPLSSWDGEKVSFDGYTVVTQRVCDEWCPPEDEECP